jgi:hypothetical protein
MASVRLRRRLWHGSDFVEVHVFERQQNPVESFEEIARRLPLAGFAPPLTRLFGIMPISLPRRLCA